MKRFLTICVVCAFLFASINFLLNYQGVYVDLDPYAPVTTFVETRGKEIWLDRGEGYELFEIRGVDMGAGIPGEYATDFGIDKETYLRWFEQIQAMGANTVRVYTIHHEDFYEAVYEYNVNNPDPLYFIHGLWVDDYVQNSHRDAYDDEFLQRFLDDSRILVDVIHGNRSIEAGRGYGSGTYQCDISPWVIGYILGVEWEDVTVVYTDNMKPQMNSYQGTYLQTTEEASAFEAMLARVGDNIIDYESTRYKEQRLVAFSNWPTTDPFKYPEIVSKVFLKCAEVDVEHIIQTEEFQSGCFASYHIYPYYPYYLGLLDPEDLMPWVKEGESVENTYRLYLRMINEHHSIPVIISEFGVPSSRGMAQMEEYSYRSQGRLSEQEQGQAIVDCWTDIKAAGCAGGAIFTWQDEWFKRTWNTMANVDLTRTPYWSDYQTNEQYFGLLSFDPGEKESVSYNDGSISEWTAADVIGQNGELTISMKYDEKYLYFMVQGEKLAEKALYIPIDTTKKSGSQRAEGYPLRFERGADFLMIIDGTEHSRILVQERYEALRAIFGREVYGKNAYMYVPDKDTPVFKEIHLILQMQMADMMGAFEAESATLYQSDTFETGKLLYGDGNPDHEAFNSISDYCFSSDGNAVEIRLPWQLLNFYTPSEMLIHDDYYENYGIEGMKISEMYVGAAWEDQQGEVPMEPLKLKAWGRKVSYHERLKRSYYIVQDMWTKGDEGETDHSAN
ncbi:MAG: hypothetical protein IJ486_03985 [Firmicutes bacterium]|nr:hypothetical protein [Bacillota bacterium]